MSEDFTIALTRGHLSDPFAILGPHVVTNVNGPTVVVRAFLPMAVTVTLRPTPGQVLPQEMKRLHLDGMFEALLPGHAALFPYQLEMVHQNGEHVTIDDPYRFPSPTQAQPYTGLNAATTSRVDIEVSFLNGNPAFAFRSHTPDNGTNATA